MSKSIFSCSVRGIDIVLLMWLDEMRLQIFLNFVFPPVRISQELNDMPYLTMGEETYTTTFQTFQTFQTFFAYLEFLKFLNLGGAGACYFRQTFLQG